MALDAALPHASPDEAELIGAELLDIAAVPDDQPPAPASPLHPSGWLRAIASLGTPRGRPARQEPTLALRALARGWSNLPATTRQAAASLSGGRLARAIADCYDDPSPLVRRHVAHAIADCRQFDQALALSSLLLDADEGVSREAERALLLLALAAHHDAAPEARDLLAELDRLEPRRNGPSREAPPIPLDIRPDAGEHATLASAIVAALETFEQHRRRGAVVAACLALHARPSGTAPSAASSRLTQWLARADQPSHAALKGFLRWSRTAFSRSIAWRWLALEPLALPATDRLSRATSAAEHEGVLREWHLGLRPARARRLASIDARRQSARAGDATPSPLPARGAISALTPRARRGLVSLAAQFRATSETRRSLLEPALIDDDALVRLAAARLGPARTVEDLCYDPAPHVARVAFLRWSSAGEPGAPAVLPAPLASLARSPDGALRAWARAEAKAWQEDNGPLARLEARRQLASDPEGFFAHARLALGSDDPGLQLRTLRTLRWADPDRRLDREVSQLCLAALPREEPMRRRVAATAAALLEHARATECVATLEACLDAGDARVRANAVEAIARRRTRRLPVPEGRRTDTLAADPAHRVRANAIRGMIEGKGVGQGVRDGVEALALMLADTRDEHRLAGAWLASRVLPGHGRSRLGQRWSELAARVAELARAEVKPPIRARALQCLALLDEPLARELFRGTSLDAPTTPEPA